MRATRSGTYTEQAMIGRWWRWTTKRRRKIVHFSGCCASDISWFSFGMEAANPINDPTRLSDERCSKPWQMNSKLAAVSRWFSIMMITFDCNWLEFLTGNPDDCNHHQYQMKSLSQFDKGKPIDESFSAVSSLVDRIGFHFEIWIRNSIFAPRR